MHQTPVSAERLWEHREMGRKCLTTVLWSSGAFPCPRNEQGVELDGKALLSEGAGRSHCARLCSTHSDYRNVTGLTSDRSDV